MSMGEIRGSLKKINARLKAIEEIIDEHPVLIIRQLAKLEVKEGDVLLVKSGYPLSPKTALNVTETLKKLIKEAGMPECKIVIMEDIELAVMRKGEKDPPEEETSKYILVEHGGVGWYHVVDAATGKPVWDNIFTYKDAMEKLRSLITKGFPEDDSLLEESFSKRRS